MRPGRGGRVAVKLMASGGGGTPTSLWRTPTPYLCLGFAFMMAVIAVALLVLICTRKKASSPSSRGKAACAVPALAPLDREPKAAVVVMPGDHAPAFLASAKPLAFVAAPRGAGEAADSMAAV